MLHILDKTSCLVVVESMLERTEGSGGRFKAFDILVRVIWILSNAIRRAVHDGSGSGHIGRAFRRRTLGDWNTHIVSQTR